MKNPLGQHYELREALGLAPKQKLPPHGIGARRINGILVWVVPRDSVTPRRRKPHRVFAQCPHCGRAIPAGRLHQHLPIHSAKAQEPAT